MTEFIDLYIKPCPLSGISPHLTMHTEDHKDWNETWQWQILSNLPHWHMRRVYINIRKQQKEDPLVIIAKLSLLVDRWNESLTTKPYEIKRITYQDILDICLKQTKRRLAFEEANKLRSINCTISRSWRQNR